MCGIGVCRIQLIGAPVRVDRRQETIFGRVRTSSTNGSAQRDGPPQGRAELAAQRDRVRTLKAKVGIDRSSQLDVGPGVAVVAKTNLTDRAGGRGAAPRR
jgi:hypothetical protein